MPTTGVQTTYAISSPSFSVEKKVGTFISTVLRTESAVVTMESHLKKRKKLRMEKTKMRRIERARAKVNGIVIVQPINIKTLIRTGRDCQMMVICRRLSDNF